MGHVGLLRLAAFHLVGGRPGLSAATVATRKECGHEDGGVTMRKGEMLSRMISLATERHAGQYDKAVAPTSCIR
jgi:hypothetical protein